MARRFGRYATRASSGVGFSLDHVIWWYSLTRTRRHRDRKKLEKVALYSAGSFHSSTEYALQRQVVDPINFPKRVAHDYSRPFRERGWWLMAGPPNLICEMAWRTESSPMVSDPWPFLIVSQRTRVGEFNFFLFYSSLFTFFLASFISPVPSIQRPFSFGSHPLKIVWCLELARGS